MRKVKVFNRFSPPPPVYLECKDASLTRQEFAHESDLNNIMRKYSAGLPPSPPGSRMPLFGDFSNVPDYQSALNHVIEAQDRFMQLPSDVRKRFDNDPGKLLDFLSHEDNRDEAVKLGLVNPVEKPVEKPSNVSVPGGNPEGAK